jgi:hypothetical protein
VVVVAVFIELTETAGRVFFFLLLDLCRSCIKVYVFMGHPAADLIA